MFRFAPEMEDQHQRIIESAMDLFLKYGIKSMTMDDVSRELGISKKTLYKFVSNKADLVDQGVKSTYDNVMNHLTHLSDVTENAIDELFEIDMFFDTVMRQQHPAMMFQLQKYYPDTFKWLEGKKMESVKKITSKNLNKGIKQGMYRDDLNIDYICYIYIAHTNIMSDESGVPQDICESSEFHKHHMEYHIRGIASTTGLQYLNKKLNKE